MQTKQQKINGRLDPPGADLTNTINRRKLQNLQALASTNPQSYKLKLQSLSICELQELAGIAGAATRESLIKLLLSSVDNK